MTNHDQHAKAVRLGIELSQFTGDLERYRHPIRRHVIYTPGVRHLAQEAEAYWLIDAIASWIGSHSFVEAVKQDARLQSLHFWTLQVDREAASAVLTARADSGEPAFITQRIPFTDFPLASIDIWCGFDGRHWTLYLPSEH
ncbi:hypothetical protein Pla123a_44640 [Posidoniimonas polymericola]|uniref:DUF6876 domain-containing protein n=1 Tax=Posidoniimonas polymericola TaxID=2528002 RepID=A0A5C5XVV1_9BACT|nr:DUF6876 family protein [Posidoniimonas polymericola]TWT67034.1 hypothetical protein Pla123a_44640 [Posidoniimonas polymericola]